MIVDPPVIAVVGIDGCGKSSTYRGALMRLAPQIQVVGIGEQVLAGGPSSPLAERRDVPLCRSAQLVGRFAKRLRWQRLYRNLKFIELAERSRIRDHVARHMGPDAIVTDGQPLVNSAAWSAAKFFKDDLATDDDLMAASRYLAGERLVPMGEAPRYLLRAWPLVALNWSRIARFSFPERVFLLDLEPSVAVDRIRVRGKPMQSHETEGFLGELRQSYIRVCGLFERTRGISVTTIRVDEVPLEEAVRIVADGTQALVESAPTRGGAAVLPSANAG